MTYPHPQQQLPRDMSGILFTNNYKKEDSHPDMRGFVTINGVEYSLSGWHKENAKGKFVKLSVKLKPESAAPASPPAHVELDATAPW